MDKYIILLVSICTLIGTASCSDYLEKYPLDKPSDATFYSTESELIMAINGIYNTSLYYQKAASPLNLVLDCASDICWDRDQGSDLQLLGEGLHVPTNTTFNELWFNGYSVISQCNMLLENMHKAQSVTSEELYKRIEGETRFFRAYHYHLLEHFFGNIPLIVKTQTIYDKPFQTSRDSVSQFILEELEVAANLLPSQYTGDDQGRITQGCALAIKAREALFTKQWEIAAESCKRIMDSGVYSLEPEYADLFNKNNAGSEEAILFIQYSRVNKFTHGVPGNLFSRMASGYSNKVPPQQLVDSYYCTDGLPINESPLYNAADPFKNRDLRLNATIVVPGSVFLGYQFETHPDSVEIWDYNVSPAVRRENQDVTNPYATFSGYLWRKYTDEEVTFRLESDLNIILIRYAEILLMYAEAKNELGQMDASAYEAFNKVRQRADMPSISNGTQEENRKLIRQERKVEFAMEGLRFFDIRRWEIAELVMNGKLYGRPVGAYKSNYIPTFDENGTPDYSLYIDELTSFDTRKFNPERDYLFPIPQKELDINSNLIQNPNY